MIGLRTDRVRDWVGSRWPRAAARWLLGACLLWAGPSWAETTLEDLARCKATTGDAERLACYDALRKAAAPTAAAPAVAVAAPEPAVPAPAPPRAPTYEPLTITDIRLDSTELKGRRVQVTGALLQLGDMVMLKVGLFDATGLFVEIKRVPREERRRIIELCGQGCTAIVRGVVAPVMAQPGLVAERVEIP